MRPAFGRLRGGSLAICVSLGACACAGKGESVPPVLHDCGSWRAGPALVDFRENSPVVLLDEMRVLVVGGHFKGRGVPLDTSEIVDVAAGTSTFTGAFVTTRTVVGASGTVRTVDGRVLTVSPWSDPRTDAPIASEIWDPTTGAWSVTGTMTLPGGPAVALPGGGVLVAGGIDWSTDEALSRTELWEPSTGTWASSGAMTTPRTNHALVMLSSGEPLALGGFARDSDSPGIRSSEVFDPATDTWGRVAEMTDHRSGTAVLLADGRVLAAGGTVESGGYRQQSATAEVYDPETGAWTAVGPMKASRSRFALTVLADGRVLATGGGQDSNVTRAAEVFDPRAGTWSDTAPMNTGRGGHHAVRLGSGEVLVVGGYPGSYSTEIYTPCLREDR